MSASTDEQLVSACLQGDEQAWSMLIDKYKNLIFSIPIKLGISRDDAGEIFQQVCLKLLAELPGIRDPRCVSAWLIRVTSHMCFQWARRERATAELDENGMETVDPAVDERLCQLEREQMLREAMLQISPRCRRLIEMLFYEEPALPYEDVANQLGLAKGSIGFIRMRCLRQLRLRLEEKQFR
jgi:RNA polymerase sigma factor (sigma-70 family)